MGARNNVAIGDNTAEDQATNPDEYNANEIVNILLENRFTNGNPFETVIWNWVNKPIVLAVFRMHPG